MNLVKNKLRVVHIPQVPMTEFKVEVKNEREAFLIEQALALQHLFLLHENIISDYSNVIWVEMYDEGTKEWTDYFNIEEMMEWNEFVEVYEDYVNGD